jgi:ribose transport system permease protein
MENKNKTSVKDLMQKLGTLMALAILFLIFCLVLPGKFPKVGNLMNILKQASINCLIASGMLCALITAGIDLSVGSNCALCTCVIGVLVQEFGIVNPVVLIIAGLAVSTFCGFLNGTLLTRLDLPHPFVSTMGMKNVLLGVALVITGSKSIGFTNKGVDGLMWIGGGSVGVIRDALGRVTFPGIPFSFILVIAVYIIFDIFLRKTALGRQIYCCGGNPEAARLSGIPSKNVLTFVYALSGFMAGMAGIISVGRLASANANAGATYDNDAIAACIVGGASFTGGKGTIWGTMIGALLMAVIRNGLNLLGASNDIQYIVIGAVIILAVTLDVVRNKMEANARKMAAK